MGLAIFNIYMPDTNEPKKKTSPLLIGCLGLVAIFILLAIIGSFLPETPKTAQPTTPAKVVDQKPAEQPTPKVEEQAIKITSNKLMEAYETNEIAADNQYKGKLLQVTGKVGTISKGIFGGSYLTLKTSDIITTVQCMLNDDQTEKAATLVPDQSIEVQGRGDGKMGNVVLKECWIK